MRTILMKKNEPGTLHFIPKDKIYCGSQTVLVIKVVFIIGALANPFFFFHF